MEKRYLCLLRGINVSGQKKIIMKDLRDLFSKNGCREVNTYIQSGNILFTRKESSKEELSVFIEELLLKEYGWEIPSLILDELGLEKLIMNNPYPNISKSTLNKPYVCIPNKKLTKSQIELFKDIHFEDEFYKPTKYGIYLYATKEANKCKLSNNFFEKKLGISCSTRNWRTLLKLQLLFNTATK